MHTSTKECKCLAWLSSQHVLPQKQNNLNWQIRKAPTALDDIIMWFSLHSESFTFWSYLGSFTFGLTYFYLVCLTSAFFFNAREQCKSSKMHNLATLAKEININMMTYEILSTFRVSYIFKVKKKIFINSEFLLVVLA